MDISQSMLCDACTEIFARMNNVKISTINKYIKCASQRIIL